MSSVTSFRERFDRLRAENPDIGMSVYAIDPAGPVTLEVITPDEQVFTFVGLTLADAIDRAFPEQPPTNVFD